MIKYLIILLFPLNLFAFEWFDINLGLGVYTYSNIRVNNQKEFLDSDPVIEPIPIFQVRVGPIFVNKDGGGMALLYFDKIKLLGMVVYEGEAYKTQGMTERKKSFYLGGGIRIYDLEGIYFRDIQDRSNGYNIKVTYAPEFINGAHTFSPRMYAQYWDKRYMDYFFGVKPTEVDSTINRYRYEGKRSVNYGIMLRNIWKFGRFQYVISGGYKFYGSRVSNSPNVKRKYEGRILTGFLYKIF